MSAGEELLSSRHGLVGANSPALFGYSADSPQRADIVT